MRFVALAAAVAVAVCSASAASAYDDVSALPPSPANFSACDPLDPSLCMFPFPNNFWLRANAGPTPLLNFSDETFPIDWLGTPIKAEQGGWNTLDGFSPIPAILTYFPGASLNGCPRIWDIAASLLPDSCTVIINTATGALVPHWVELDHSSDDANGYQANRTFMIWPAHKLEHSTRYVVGIRNVTTDAGALVPSSPAFADLRDNVPSGNWDIEGRRRVFADIFGRLAAVGVAQASLQLAWDFTTGSQPSITKSFVSMRDDALSRFPASGPEFVIDFVFENYSTNIGRKLQGHFMVPWYLNHEGIIPWVDNRLVLSPAGLPVYQSLQPINFTVLVPWSLMNATAAPGRALQYGHGLFGDQGEVETEYLQTQANEFGYVLFAVDWMGMSQWDEPGIIVMLATDMSNFAMIPDRLHQGMLNFLSMMRLMKTGLRLAPEMTNAATKQSFVDPTKLNYYGNSQGGIMGTVYMATSTDVTRGCIGVGGGPFGILLPRSSDFTDLFIILKIRYEKQIELMGLLAVIQLLWDRMEPAGYVDAISGNILPNTPAHRVIFQYGLGDAQVTLFGTYQLARAANASMFTSNVREGNETLFGFPFVADNAVVSSGNVVTGWDFGAPEIPFVNQPAGDATDAHEKPRRELTAQAQMHNFFETGDVINTCKGPCRNVSAVAEPLVANY